jgi:ketosteroid isomerase-like protein
VAGGGEQGDDLVESHLGADGTRLPCSREQGVESLTKARDLEAVREADGLRAAAPFAVVVRVRDGRVVLWREYQNPAAMALLATE